MSLSFFFFVKLSFPSPSEFNLQHEVGVVLCLEVCRILIVHPQSLKRQENVAMAPLGLSRRKERTGPYKTRRGCSWDLRLRGGKSAWEGSVCALPLRKTAASKGAGCSTSAAGDVRATISDFNGICVMKYGSCFSCLRMRVCHLSLCSSLCGSDVCGCSEWVHRETEDALSCFS